MTLVVIAVEVAVTFVSESQRLGFHGLKCPLITHS
jgi:hypothetical protein